MLFLVLEEFTEMFLKGFPGSGGAFRKICELLGGVEEVHKILGMLSVLHFLVELPTIPIDSILLSEELLRGGLGLKVDGGGGKGGECANNRFVHFNNSLLSFAGLKLYKSPEWST